MHKVGKEYFCPVLGCGKRCKSPMTLKKHYAAVGLHQVTEMLDQGLPVWFYRENTKPMVTDTLEWLLKRGYVQHTDPKKRLAVEHACEEESGDDDIF